MSDTQPKDKAEKAEPNVYASVREAAAAYRERLIAVAPEPERHSQSQTDKPRNAMRPR